MLTKTDVIKTDALIIGAGPVGLFAVFELGPKREWWNGKPVDPYPSLVEALK